MHEFVWAQAPTGAISGFVTDTTGARIRVARVVVVASKEMGLKRTVLNIRGWRISCRQTDWTDQRILGLTSQLGSRLVNDLRFSYFFVSFGQHAPGTSDCSMCLGIGAPLIAIEDQLSIALSSTALGRRYHLNDVVSRQKGLAIRSPMSQAYHQGLLMDFNF
jgi:hypothetical protein